MSDKFSAADYIHALMILQQISHEVARLFLD